jgi:hypothetical protein
MVFKMDQRALYESKYIRTTRARAKMFAWCLIKPVATSQTRLNLGLNIVIFFFRIIYLVLVDHQSLLIHTAVCTYY